MEKMSVAIMTAERAFARALARGLAEESSGLAISFCITDTADEERAVQLAQALAKILHFIRQSMTSLLTHNITWCILFIKIYFY